MRECRYTRAHTVEEAVAALAEADGEANVIAGGVALGILMNERLLEPEWLIDIARVEAMKGIATTPAGGLRIGALSTHTQVERSAAVAAACPLLTEMAAEIACGRIRNRGTVGGNICLADPQGDPPVALLALGATLRVAGPGGTRDIPADGFFTDLYTTALEEDELLVEIEVPPAPANAGVAYTKFAARRAMDYTSTISAAVSLVRDAGDGRIARIGIGLGGVGITSVRPKAAEAALCGRQPDADSFAQMGAALAREIEPLEDHLYSADYKRHVAAVMLRRAVARAYERSERG
jgi:carbon-monoxide dehydrogenase medium subunit